MALLPAALLVLVLVLFRLCSILPITRRRPNPRSAPAHILILLGSGGHTAEMLLLLSSLSPKRYKLRTYLYSTSDTLSVQKAAEFEKTLGSEGKYNFVSIPRARSVGQSWVTTPWSCVLCLWGCVRAFAAHGVPNLVVVNGPGTAVVVVGVCLAYRFFGIGRGCRVVYVESFARVRRLSLSGKLVYWVVDRFLVQWKGLAEGRRRAEYRGVLV